MTGRIKKRVKNLVYAGIIALALACGARDARAQLFFENIPVIIAPGDQWFPSIWGNYIVWRGAVNEAYDISQRKIVQMPGLNIGRDPAIWDNKVVFEGGNGYYDLDLRQMVSPDGLSVGSRPAIHNNKVAWSGSTGYYDLNSQQMVYPADLSIGGSPDIFGDIIVWYQSDGYFDVGLQQMVYPKNLHVGSSPAIFDNKIVWNYLMGDYYDIDLQQYVSLEGAHLFYLPDIFEDTIVWNNYDAIPPSITDIFLWDPVNKQTQITESGCAGQPQIYNDIVVWMDSRNGDWDIYMAVIPEPSTIVLFGTGLAALLHLGKRRNKSH